MAHYRPRYLIHALLLLAAPIVLVLIVLVASGALEPLPATVGGLVAVAAMAALLASHFGDLAVLRGYVQSLRNEWNEEEPVPRMPPVSSPGLAPELTGAIAESLRERRARRLELRAAMLANEAVLAGLPDPLLLLDRDGIVRGANPAAERMFDTRIKGRPLSMALRQPDLLEAANRALESGRSAEVEFVQHGHLDRYYIARIASLPERGPDGAVAVIALHDVTTIRRAERLRADFVANASHELRTPLSSLLGFVETMQGPAKDDPDAQARFLAIMHEQARRMANLVEDLLSLSRIEMDEHTLPHETTDLADLLKRVASALELRAREKQMTIELDLPRTPARVRGDGGQLTQVFQNLIDNAIKYGAAGTTVTVSIENVCEPGGPARAAEHTAHSRRSRPGLAVSVIDQGEGIARHHIPRLTERFYRADSARSRAMGGTGLGLAIVKHIVNRHRGEIEIDSTPGKGSRFTVYLPTTPTPAAQSDSSRTAAA